MNHPILRKACSILCCAALLAPGVASAVEVTGPEGLPAGAPMAVPQVPALPGALAPISNAPDLSGLPGQAVTPGLPEAAASAALAAPAASLAEPGAAPAEAAAPEASATAQPDVSASVAPAQTPEQAAQGAQPAARRALTRMAKAAASKDSGAVGAAFDASRPDQGISRGWVDAMIRRDAAAPSGLKRLRDNAQRQGFSAVALNGKLIAQHNDRYTTELPESAITDQKASGRCWDFAGLNVIMTGLLAEGRKLPFTEFSENYIYFYSLLEKANSYLNQTVELAVQKAAGKKIPPQELREAVSVGNEVEDGGWFEYFEFLVAKYGLVPKSAMPETASSLNSATLLKELQTSLATSAAEILRAADKNNKKPAQAAKAATAIQQRAMARAWKVLSTHLGTPPAHFDLREEGTPDKSGPVAEIPAKITRYTPQQFAKDYVGFKPKDYVVITNSPMQKKGVVYEVPNSAIGTSKPGQPQYNLRFMDLSAKRMAQLVAASIRGGHPVWFASDVIDDVDVKSGIMHPLIFLRNAIYGFTKKEASERLSRKNSVYFGLNQPDHAMAITGVDQPAGPNGPIVKMKVKNSWGAQVGTNGFFHMYMKWFENRVFEVIVHKKFLNPKELKAWEGKATTMEDGDGMF